MITHRSHLILFPTVQEATATVDNSPLSFIPSWTLMGHHQVRCALSGLGLVGSALNTARLLHLNPEISRVILVGIAGTYNQQKALIGEAYWCDRVLLHGIGVGESSNFAELPFPQFSDHASSIFNLSVPSSSAHSTMRFLSVTTASSDRDLAAIRANSYQEYLGEEMEGAGVAAACSSAGVTCSMVRGISNLAGDRDFSAWQVTDALHSAKKLLIHALDVIRE